MQLVLGRQIGFEDQEVGQRDGKVIDCHVHRLDGLDRSRSAFRIARIASALAAERPMRQPLIEDHLRRLIVVVLRRARARRVRGWLARTTRGRCLRGPSVDGPGRANSECCFPGCRPACLRLTTAARQVPVPSRSIASPNRSSAIACRANSVRLKTYCDEAFPSPPSQGWNCRRSKSSSASSCRPS